MLDIDELYKEVSFYIDDIDVMAEGERIYSNYQKVVAYSLRLAELHNEIAFMEIMGKASTELKKFRTMILDPTIERFEKISSYESRKLTAMQIELNLEGKG